MQDIKLYKGNLSLITRNNDSIMERPLATFDELKQDMIFFNPSDFQEQDKKTLRSYLRALVSLDDGIDDEEIGLRATRSDILKLFDKLFPKEATFVDIEEKEDIEILFTIVMDNAHNFYAREYYTGLLFPILTLNNIEHEYYLKSHIRENRYIKYVVALKSFVLVSNMDKFETIISHVNEASLDEIASYIEPQDIEKHKEFLERLRALSMKNKFKNHKISTREVNLENIQVESSQIVK